jgi:membrane protease YdiL (CAAX protease family)
MPACAINLMFRNHSMSRVALIVEFCAVFVALPLAYRFLPLRIPVLPLLWAVTLYAWILLLRDLEFDHARLWNGGAIPAQIGSILAIFAAAAALIWLGVHRFAPQLEWGFVLQHPAFWAIVMIAYPVLSVYPQGLVYRAFFFQRYAVLFPCKWTMIVASAAAFALMHIIFRNWIAVALTFVGGLLFAWRYAVTGSLATSSFEHALYGCWLFTVGLGQYFYHGTIATVGSAIRR